jgi:ubiquinone/menaquinone biosynthesis C-methylase UbiE|tara:strand:- start:869 stop:1144 length:276 start_codon:yes stop_codon:yes gene_type:complete
LSRKFYNENSHELAQQYLSKSFDQVHQSWSQFVPAIIKNPHARILDIGAGSGRDAKHFAKLAVKEHGTENNIQVFAVEPCKPISRAGRKTN